MPRSVRCAASRGWFAVVVPCLLVAGCNNADDSVKTYKLAVPEQKGKAEDVGTPGDTGPAKVRLLGAIIPAGGENSFFVKFTGPIEKVDPNEKDFDAFLNSIRVPGEGGKPISWTVPAGWKEAPARAMRVVTIQKADGSAPDLYISDPFSGSLLSNVNRWRTGDVGIKAATEAELPTVTKEVQLGMTKAYRVDFRGPGGKGGMSAPFMGK